MGTELKVYNEDANSEFAKLLSDSLNDTNIKEGSIVEGTIEEIEEKRIHLFIKGAKSSAIIEKSEVPFEKVSELQLGDKLKVYIEKLESRDGGIVASHERAIRGEAWEEIEKIFEKQEVVQGIIKAQTKGGYIVEIKGIQSFCPNSQLSDGIIKNPKELFNEPQPFLLLKLDRLRFNIISSRRAVLEKEKNKNKEEVIKKFKVNDIVRGARVKSISSFGAFVTVEGSLDCLLHQSCLSHLRVTNINEFLKVGQELDLKIIDIDLENLRMSLSLKDMKKSPYESLKEKFEIGKIYPGKVKKVFDFGAFVSLSEKDEIEGMIHSSMISHTQKNVNPKSVFKEGQEIEVMLSEVDETKGKISLDYKSTQPNPLDEFLKKYPVGSTVKDAVVNSVKDFGVFVTPEGTKSDAFIHFKQWSFVESSKELENVKKGDKVSFVVLEPRDGKISGSRRATLDDPFNFFKDKKISDAVSVRVNEVMSNGLRVDVGEKRYSTIIRKSELAAEKQNCRPDRWQPGDTVESQIVELDLANRKVKLSIRKLEEDQNAELVERYGSSSSGMSLASVLGEALDKKNKDKKD